MHTPELYELKSESTSSSNLEVALPLTTEFGDHVNRTVFCDTSSPDAGVVITDTVTLGATEERLATALMPTARLRLHEECPASIAGNQGLVRLAINRPLPFADNRYPSTGKPVNETSVGC